MKFNFFLFSVKNKENQLIHRLMIDHFVKNKMENPDVNIRVCEILLLKQLRKCCIKNAFWKCLFPSPIFFFGWVINL